MNQSPRYAAFIAASSSTAFGYSSGSGHTININTVTVTGGTLIIDSSVSGDIGTMTVAEYLSLNGNPPKMNGQVVINGASEITNLYIEDSLSAVTVAAPSTITTLDLLGTATFNAASASSTITGITGTDGDLNVNYGADVILLDSSTISHVQIDGLMQLAAGDGSTILTATDSLQINSTGTLDLTNNSLVTDEDESVIVGYLQSGYDHGAWDGMGIVSSTAASGGIIGGETLGYATSAELGGVYNGSAIDSSATVVKYTWIGDTNLDGVVDDGVNSGDTNNDVYRMNNGNGTDWYNGDLNYDQSKNADDWSLFGWGVAKQNANLDDNTMVAGVAFGSGEAEPLWDAISAGSEAAFESDHPTWIYDNADFNHDGIVDSSDLDTFDRLSALYASPYALANITATGGYVTIGDETYFVGGDATHGTELWKSDGTATGTVMVADINPGSGSSYPQYLTDLDGELFFSANDGTHGTELWKSDGTAAGTVMAADIRSGSASSTPTGLINFDGELFFDADDGTHGGELWKSDGTSAGTVMVKDINPGSGSSGLNYPLVMGGNLYFVGADATSDKLWKSDGTSAGTISLANIGFTQILTDVDGTLYFAGYDSTHGSELWKSDGTVSGTMMVDDVYPGINSSLTNSYFTSIVGAGDEVYFVATDGTHGIQLWESDGTAADTQMIQNNGTNPNSYPPYWLTNVDGTLYFDASDGTHGYQLWKTDGTSSGTVMITTNFSASGASYPSYPVFPTNADGTLYFFANDGTHGTQLWKSDGTTAGTVMVTSGDFIPSGSFAEYVGVGNDSLFFEVTNGSSYYQFWALAV